MLIFDEVHLVSRGLMVVKDPNKSVSGVLLQREDVWGTNNMYSFLVSLV